MTWLILYGFNFTVGMQGLKEKRERNLGLGEPVLICVGGLQVGRHIALALVLY